MINEGWWGERGDTIPFDLEVDENKGYTKPYRPDPHPSWNDLYPYPEDRENHHKKSKKKTRKYRKKDLAYWFHRMLG